MGMFEKMKLWMLTDESKQKYLMEKEKKERANKRKNGNKSQDNEEEVVKKKKVVKKVVKRKDEPLFNEPDIEKEEVIDEVSIKKDSDTLTSNYKEEPSVEDIFKEVNKNIEKVKILKEVEESEVEESEVEESEVEESEISVDVDSENLSEESESEIKEDNVGNVSSLDTEDDYVKKLHLEEEEERKKELVKKKLDEKEKYFEIMLSLPPTSNMDLIITRALSAGVPEWYLRETSVIVDDEEENVVSTLVVGLDELRKENQEENNRLTIEIAHRQAEVETKIKEGLERISSNRNKPSDEIVEEVLIEDPIEESDIIEESLVEDEVDILDEVTEDRNEDTILQNDITLDEMSEIENDTDEVIFDEEVKVEVRLIDNEPSDVEVTDEVTVEEPISEETEEVYDSEVSVETDDFEDVTEIEDDVISDNFETEELTETEEDITPEESDILPKVNNRDLLKDRLKHIAENRVKSVVLNVTGDQIFVKEEKEDKFGNKKTNYKNYKVDEEDAKNVIIGQEISDEMKLEKVDKKVLIDGEEYDLSKSDEDRLINALAKREIWIVTSDDLLVSKKSEELQNTRYKVYGVTSERDFVMATRSTYNLLVITQNIPANVKGSIVGHLKYLSEEKKRGRIVTLEESLVKAKVIEFTFNNLDFSELESYYNTFEASLYSDSQKSIRDILQVISFDLTEGMVGQVDITEEEYEEDTRFLDLELGTGDVELTLDDSQIGDLELDLDSFGEISLDNVNELSLSEKLGLDNIKGEK
jgi:hypothetical protein